MGREPGELGDAAADVTLLPKPAEALTAPRLLGPAKTPDERWAMGDAAGDGDGIIMPLTPGATGVYDGTSSSSVD